MVSFPEPCFAYFSTKGVCSSKDAVLAWSSTGKVTLAPGCAAQTAFPAPRQRRRRLCAACSYDCGLYWR